MVTDQISFHVCDHCLDNDPLSCNLFWDELKSWLKPHILTWLYQYNLPLWLGQEQDIANDVLQETFIRILKYARRSLSTDSRLIESLESFGMTVARNYIRDMWRKEYRLVPFTLLFESSQNNIQDWPSIDPSELALAHLMSKDTLTNLAHLIKDFPPGQRRALLIDLAQRSDFDEESGPLHVIFLELGINLYEYKLLRPFNAIERSRYAALLSVAYKRLRQQFWALPENFVVDPNPSSLSNSKEQIDMEYQSRKNSEHAELNKSDRDILAHIDTLQDPYKRAVHLHYLEGYSYPEMATLLTLPIGTVKSHVSRGMQMLRDITALKGRKPATMRDLEQAEKCEEVRRYLDVLEDPYREAMRLHYLEGYKYPEIASKLNIPLNTVKSYIHRGMKLLETYRKQTAFVA